MAPTPTSRSFGTNIVVAQSKLEDGSNFLYLTNTDDDLIVCSFIEGQPEKDIIITIPIEEMPHLADMAISKMRRQRQTLARYINGFKEEATKRYEAGKAEFETCNYQEYIHSKPTKELDWALVDRYLVWKIDQSVAEGKFSRYDY